MLNYTQYEIIDASTESDYSTADKSTQYEDVPVFKADVGVQCVRVSTAHVSTQCGRVKSHMAVQCSVETEHKGIQLDISYSHQCTKTDKITDEVSPFGIEQIQDNDKLINFYTGFPTILHLITCFQFLGPAVAVLSYDPSKIIQDAAKACALGRPHILTPLVLSLGYQNKTWLFVSRFLSQLSPKYLLLELIFCL